MKVEEAGTSHAGAPLEVAPPPRNEDVPTVRIEPPSGWASLRLREVWDYRELLYFFTWRDIKVRYKQTLIGASWALIVPFFTMVVFSLFFGNLANVPSDGAPYPIWSYAGLVPWTFFATSVATSSSSLVASSNLLTKVYFPRLAVPIGSVLAVLVDFFLAFGLLLVLMPFYDVLPTPKALLMFPFLLLGLVVAVGVGLWLSAANVVYRDVKYAVPFLVNFWMFATPVAYSSALLDQPWRTLYGLNPMVGVVEGFRWALLDVGSGPGWITVASAGAALLLLVSGAFFFKRMERVFADVV
jgi:lipopolysaccharide transport system permease protein